MLALLLVVARDTKAKAESAAPNLGAAQDNLIGQGDLIDVQRLGAKLDGLHDDGPALASAIRRENALMESGHKACIYIGPGNLRIGGGSVIPPFSVSYPGCVLGSGSEQSNIYLDAGFAGNVFSWSEAWGNTHPGGYIRGISIHGNTTLGKVQNAIVLYNRNDFFSLNDVNVFDILGSCFSAGEKKGRPEAYLRESRVTDLRCWHTGSPSTGAVLINSSGNGDSSNELRFQNVDVYAPRSAGVVLLSSGERAVRDITFNSLRIEGLERANYRGDLLVIGSPEMTSAIFGVRFTNTELIDPYPESVAVHIEGNPNATPYFITFDGFIGGGEPNGGGIKIDRGRDIRFSLYQIHTAGAQIAISPNAGSGISLEENFFHEKTVGGSSELEKSSTLSSIAEMKFSQLPLCTKERAGSLALVTDAKKTNFAASLVGGGKEAAIALCAPGDGSYAWTAH